MQSLNVTTLRETVTVLLNFKLVVYSYDIMTMTMMSDLLLRLIYGGKAFHSFEVVRGAGLDETV
jgi:hypothetical protein